MRLVCTLNDQKKAHALSVFLTAEGIENQLDITTNTDWGSNNYGDVTCRIWIIDEDLVDAAKRWVDLFQTDPTNPVFQNTALKKGPQLPPEVTSEKESPLKLVKLSRTQPTTSPQPLGTITLYLLIICCILFFATEVTEPTIAPFPPSLPPTALFSAPIKKKMLYDYPYAFELVDKLVKMYGLERLMTPEDLPTEGKYLLEQFYKTPYWHGYYDTLVHELQPGDTQKSDVNANAPLFEKIRQGEFWRLFTPALLHSDILHIAFNMIWLFILGKQLEQRLGSWRYLLFIIITGIFSNTAQYLMSGPNFIGFSGILCAMLAFIWVRQKISPWEGYQLDKTTMKFMAFFILSMFAIQLVSFYFEVNQQASISPGIANTAHLSGALFGYLLGRLSLFSWRF